MTEHHKQNRIKMLYECFLDGPEWLYIPSLKRREGHYRSLITALSAWGAGLFHLKCSTVLAVLMPFLVLTTLYGIISVDSPVRLLAAAFLAVLLVELTVGWIFRPRFLIRRTMPKRVRRGDSFVIRFDAVNLRRIPSFHLRFDPFPYPRGLVTEHRAERAELAGGATGSATAQVTAYRRGIYSFTRPRVESLFPLGFLKWGCAGNDGTDLTVFPSFFELTEFRLPPGAIREDMGEHAFSRIGESLELLGNRDYRAGDEIRHLDWRGSARRGKPVVREFLERQMKKIALLVDLETAPKRRLAIIPREPEIDETLEAELSLAAATAYYLTGRDAVVELLAAGKSVYKMTTGRGTGTFEELCDLLAAAEPMPKAPLAALEAPFFAQLDQIGGAVIFLLKDDKDRRAFVEKLERRGVAVRVILLGMPSDGIPEHWRTVEPKNVLAGKITTL